MGDGQREEGRSSLSFNAWIAIAVGLLVVIVLGLHVPVYFTYRHEQDVAARVRRMGGSCDIVILPTLPMSGVLAFRWKPYGRLFERVIGVGLATVANDADVAQVAELTRLIQLDLSDTQVTDAGLIHLAEQTGLIHLFLYTTQVTDAGLVHLAGLTNLQWLALMETHVTDAGLVHLAGLTNLQRLWLTNAQVTDAGLVHLAGLTELEWLDLRGTQVTDAGVAELKRKLPHLMVTR